MAIPKKKQVSCSLAPANIAYLAHLRRTEGYLSANSAITALIEKAARADKSWQDWYSPDQEVEGQEPLTAPRPEDTILFGKRGRPSHRPKDEDEVADDDW